MTGSSLPATPGFSSPNDYPVSVAGEAQPGEGGRDGVRVTMVSFLENPAFNGATEGTFRGDTKVRLTRDEAGRPHLVVLGYDLLSFEPDEESVAKAALEIVEGSPLAAVAANPGDEILDAVEHGKFRRRSDLLTLHTD